MFWFFLLIIVALVGALVAYWLIQGIAVFAVISYYILKLIFRVTGKAAGPGGVDIVGRLDEKFFGISRQPEIVSGPLTDDFKATAKGRLAPDMWTDGRRLYFEVGDKSYSVKTDLEGARKRKNELLAELKAQKKAPQPAAEG
jgi:hypothetical protein